MGNVRPYFAMITPHLPLPETQEHLSWIFTGNPLFLNGIGAWMMKPPKVCVGAPRLQLQGVSHFYATL